MSFPGGSFAPTRVKVVARGAATVRVGERPRSVPVRASATAELAPASDAILGGPAHGEGGGYDGPLAYRMGKAMRPDVAAAFDRMAAAARRDGLALSITSAFRSDAEQARLFAANPNPKWVAPPGTSLHRYATELDLGPPAAYAWLAANARPFGFIHRYAWEPWHYGFGAEPARPRAPGAVRARLVGAARRRPRPDPPRAAGVRAAALPRPDRRGGAALERADGAAGGAALRGVGLQPVRGEPRRARAGSRSSCRARRATYGLADPYDPVAAIDAQAHLMSDLLRRSAGRSRWRWPRTTRAPGAVERYGGVPPYAETRAYVARILGLLGGAGALAGRLAFEVRLVE